MTFRFFQSMREVNPNDGSWAASGGYVGRPHGGRAQLTNVLLFGGEVLTIDLRKFSDTPNRYWVDARDWSATSNNRKVSNLNQHALQ